MTKTSTMRALMAVLIFGLAVAGTAHALPWHEGHEGHPHGAIMMWARHNLKPDQWKQIHSIVAAERTNLKSLHANVRTARQALVTALLNGQDSAQAMDQLEHARAALLAERVKLAQKVIAVLTPSQKTQAQQFWSKWQAMLERQRQEREQLLGAASPAPSPSSQQ